MWYYFVLLIYLFIDILHGTSSYMKCMKTSRANLYVDIKT